MLWRDLVFSALVSLIAAVIVTGTIMLTAYNLPSEVLRLDANALIIERVIVGAILFLGPLLATAPLIEWWYRRLGRAMNITVEANRG